MLKFKILAVEFNPLFMSACGTFSLICIVSFKTVVYWLTMNLPHRGKAGIFEIVFYFISDVGQGERCARALFPFIQDD